MPIEKRIIKGEEVGFDTETNSYCNLPEKETAKPEKTVKPKPEKE